MSSRMFMIDIETTGIDPDCEEILQIAAVEMTFNADGKWDSGREFNFYQHSDRKPDNDFSKKYLTELHKTCNEVDYTPEAEVRQALLDFFRECGASPPNVFLCGWNAGFFDLPFLIRKGYLVPPTWSNGKMQGDFHYRIYDLNGAIQFQANVDGKMEVNPYIKKAEGMSPKIEGSKHDALFDCRRQINILNGLLQIARSEVN